ncbi:MAG: bifunctional diaminohydroxyphosphoribosylaminopyrimidine deaminase/5-amino-6-(5-phosphoribosylamino)uracil reductase RibD [Acidobacteria bacterium]|nr:bifunctional diaminohydroxyphosphoribosylaminopyrimidine deaminase/5-amino-6-(5-phosphoribosylamino)uracil reductase RibD [Acidobacteriota bacterium]
MFDARDRRYMKMALALAEKHIGLASPNPSVGCVVVRDGKVIGRGWHEYEGLDHAEVRALKTASGETRNATVYVTLEPCSHTGRTPPCAELLIREGIRRVVVARVDPNPLVSGRGIKKLRSSGMRVDVGLMEEQAGEIIEAFACRMTTGLPLVVSKVGMSLDGRIGTGKKGGHRISSPEGREFGQYLRLRADALLVGVGTILSDDPQLTYRGGGARGRPLLRVILDTHLRTPPDARIFKMTGPAPVLIFCNKRRATGREKALEAVGAEIIPIPSASRILDLAAVLEELAKRNVLGLLVEGGSRVHWEFLSRRMVDCFYFIVAPMILGGENAIPSVGGKGYGTTAVAPKFRIRRGFSAGSDMVFEGYPSYSRSIISPWRPQETAASCRSGRPPASMRK